MSSVEAATRGPLNPLQVTVVEDQPSYAHTITSGVHRLRGDLMPEAGGGDEGPSPKEYIMAALGMCTSMTVRMYAQRHAWPLQHVEVVVRENTRCGVRPYHLLLRGGRRSCPTLTQPLPQVYLMMRLIHPTSPTSTESSGQPASNTAHAGPRPDVYQGASELS